MPLRPFMAPALKVGLGISDLPSTPFHGGMTIVTLPNTRDMQARRMMGLAAIVETYPHAFMRCASTGSTLDSFSAPPRMPIQQLPHDPLRHRTGIGPSWQSRGLDE